MDLRAGPRGTSWTPSAAVRTPCPGDLLENDWHRHRRLARIRAGQGREECVPARGHRGRAMWAAASGHQESVKAAGRPCREQGRLRGAEAAQSVDGTACGLRGPWRKLGSWGKGDVGPEVQQDWLVAPREGPGQVCCGTPLHARHWGSGLTPGTQGPHGSCQAWRESGRGGGLKGGGGRQLERKRWVGAVAPPQCRAGLPSRPLPRV